MKINLSIFLLIFYFIFASSSYSQSINNNVKSIENYIYSKYGNKPLKKLDTITNYLDSSAIAEHCYVYISNQEKTKFIAFYLVETKTSSYKLINQEYGGVYFGNMFSSKKAGQIETFGYTVKGMSYKGKWYYDLEEYHRFYTENIKKGRKILLEKTLINDKFFKKNSLKEKPSYWKKNGFEMDKTFKEYPISPRIVSLAKMGKRTRTRINHNNNIESIACKIQKDLWGKLQESDSTMYTKLYKGKCLKLYNKEHNIVLLPIFSLDKSEQLWLTYFVLKLSEKSTRIYNWTSFPPRKIINTEKYSLEVIDDLNRTFPKTRTWGWGTVNMISKQEFWKKLETELEIIE